MPAWSNKPTIDNRQPAIDNSFMPVIRDEAVVLGRLDYSENSQILVLFTREHGKARSIAKGIRRGTKTRFATGIDLLDAGTSAPAPDGDDEGTQRPKASRPCRHEAY